MPEKQTFHPDRRGMHGAAVALHKALDVSSFVEQMKGALEKVVAEAKANDPAELKRRIKELEKQVKAPVVPALVHSDRTGPGSISLRSAGLQ